jgi:hypothetical protein
MTRNISKQELAFIKKAIPNLQKLVESRNEWNPEVEYKMLFISVFDHWLNEDDDAGELIHVDSDLKELNRRRDLFKKMINNLFSKTDLYTYKYKRHFRFFIKKPEALSDIHRLCDFKNLWSARGRSYSFIIPEFSAVYQEEFDWTNILFYKDEETISPILEIANNIGLKILK